MFGQFAVLDPEHVEDEVGAAVSRDPDDHVAIRSDVHDFRCLTRRTAGSGGGRSACGRRAGRGCAGTGIRPRTAAASLEHLDECLAPLAVCGPAGRILVVVFRNVFLGDGTERQLWPTGAYKILAEVLWDDGAQERSYALSTLRLGPKDARR